MKLEDYFRDELAYLRNQGAEFSQIWPQLTRFLSEQSTDPDVERLLEGFAFLSGSLREKIEDEFPELTHGLLNMLWPNYLRSVPSMTIVHFSPKEQSISEAAYISENVLLGAKAIDGLSCQFSTCRDVWILPIELNDVQANNSNENGKLILSFDVFGQISLEKINLDKMRLYLGNNDHSATKLYLWFLHHFKSAIVLLDGVEFSVPNIDISPVGFNNQDALLPYPKNVYSGYRILQDYFCFPESLLFLDFRGFGSLPQEKPVKKIEISFNFDKPLPADVKIHSDSLRLHCAPAVNLFPHHSEPLQLDGRSVSYPLRASHSRPEFYEIFSVKKIEGWLTKHGHEQRNETQPARIYHPFESFRHQTEYEKERSTRYYHLGVHNALKFDGLEHSITFVRGDESLITDDEETISAELLCSNRRVPTKLGIGDINVSYSDTPPFVSFKNITHPTLPLRPIMDGGLQWTLVSNLSLNYLSLLNKDALLQIIRNYDFPAMNDQQASKISQRRLSGIERLETNPVDRLIKGRPVRGIQSTLYMKQSAFSSEGDLYLFGSVLARFFSLFASVNAFHELTVINTDSQESYRWPLQLGSRPLI
ncbi:type VI secretion protein [Hafnia alvei]|uniref:type VI secretion system baseplate subunit TssF n=1 Tax=Hafnia alvei TaxID=569 RepID=UPI000583B3B7|nr:type VI secretion system baseplate subunit TssF [Hafnia alvei]KID06946.1 type VI secretion protein [Hafnia alvei]